VIADLTVETELSRLGAEHAALRRVAALVTRHAAPAEVFEAVIAEVGRLAPAEGAALSRFESEGTVTTIGIWSKARGYVPSGTRHVVAEGTVARVVLETLRPGRIDSYAEVPGSLAELVRGMGWRSAVGAPIVIEGRLWGVVGVASMSDCKLPPGTEERLALFTELLATAVANSESREQVTRLADAQAAVRRVAMLVARAAPPAHVIDVVIAEVGRLVPADAAVLNRYEPDGTLTSLGIWDRAGHASATHLRTRFVLEGDSLAKRVLDTRRPGRKDSYEGLPGVGNAAARKAGWGSSVAVPVIVDGRLWGLMAVASKGTRPLPPEAEERLVELTELLALAIANAESRAQLAASRARIVATADATRRRIERDLHDGAQQRLISLALALRAAEATVPPELGQLRGELSRVVEGMTSALDELREMATGIHPAILAEGGLGPALKTLARRSAIPVELDVRAAARLPERVEVATYYVVSEALANAAKHAEASVVQVDVAARDGALRVDVRDDGCGGADPARGSGLLGLMDRAEAVGGTIALQSPRGRGTWLQVELPLDDLSSPGG
jgi:signal transduction histidine kinase